MTNFSSQKHPDNTDPLLPLYGNNLKDLKENLDRYLAELLDKINKPMKDCPHCDGYGVIFEENKEEIKKVKNEK